MEIDEKQVLALRMKLSDVLADSEPRGAIWEKVVASIQLAAAAITSIPADKTQTIPWGVKCFMETLQELNNGECELEYGTIDEDGSEHPLVVPKSERDMH